MAVEDVGQYPRSNIPVNQSMVPQSPGAVGFYDDGYRDPFPIQNDPYAYRQPPQSMNVMTMLALLNTGIKTEEDFKSIMKMMMILVDNVGRIPNIEMSVVKSLQRDWVDIIELSECQGTQLRVLSLMKELLFEIKSLDSYGGAPLVGLTSIGAMITQKQLQEQTVRYPNEPQQRKKVFGIF